MLEAAAEPNVVVPRRMLHDDMLENVGWPHAGRKDDLDGNFRSINLIVWCPGFVDVLSGSTCQSNDQMMETTVATV